MKSLTSVIFFASIARAALLPIKTTLSDPAAGDALAPAITAAPVAHVLELRQFLSSSSNSSARQCFTSTFSLPGYNYFNCGTGCCAPNQACQRFQMRDYSYSSCCCSYNCYTNTVKYPYVSEGPLFVRPTPLPASNRTSTSTSSSSNSSSSSKGSSKWWISLIVLAILVLMFLGWVRNKTGIDVLGHFTGTKGSGNKRHEYNGDYQPYNSSSSTSWGQSGYTPTVVTPTVPISNS